MSSSFFDILSLRYQWEELVSGYQLDCRDGTLDNLQHFIDQGAKGNRFRKNYDEALELAKVILDYANDRHVISV